MQLYRILMKGAASMKKRMLVFLLLGIFCVVTGLILAGTGIKPKIVPAFMVAMGGGWIGGWAIWYFSTKGGTLIRDEMVVRIETLSGNYAFQATIWLLIALGIINMFYSLPWSVADLLVVMMIFMGLSNILFRWILMKQGKAE
jgi:hypothetical protein